MKRRSLLIDLTALLDVILILLFLVLSGSTLQQAPKQAALEASLQHLQEQIEELKRHQLPQGDTEKHWHAIYQDKIGKLELLYPKNRDESFTLFRGDTPMKKPQTDDLKNWLLAELSTMPQEVIILSFSYYDRNIYWRDYQQTRRILLEIQKETDHTIIYEEIPQKE